MKYIVPFIIALLIAGCSTQPSRSQTMKLSKNSFTFTFHVNGNEKKPLKTADGTVIPFTIGDFFSQNMSIETGGDESNSQESSVNPNLTVPVGDKGVDAIATIVSGTAKGIAKALDKSETPKAETE